MNRANDAITAKEDLQKTGLTTGEVAWTLHSEARRMMQPKPHELRELMSLIEATRLLVEDDTLDQADRQALADLLLNGWLPSIAIDIVRLNYPTTAPPDG